MLEVELDKWFMALYLDRMNRFEAGFQLIRNGLIASQVLCQDLNVILGITKQMQYSAIIRILRWENGRYIVDHKRSHDGNSIKSGGGEKTRSWTGGDPGADLGFISYDNSKKTADNACEGIRGTRSANQTNSRALSKFELKLFTMSQTSVKNIDCNLRAEFEFGFFDTRVARGHPQGLGNIEKA